MREREGGREGEGVWRAMRRKERERERKRRRRWREGRRRSVASN